MPKQKEKQNVKTTLVAGESLKDFQAIQFQNQEQIDLFIVQLTAANNGSTDPIILPDGSELRPLTDYEKWFWEQMARINLLLLLWSGLR